MAYIKPAGQVGTSAILADRDTGAIYVMVDGRLHPALNLISARLIAGEQRQPDVRQGRRTRQVSAGSDGRNRRRPNANADPHRRWIRSGRCATPRRRPPRPRRRASAPVVTAIAGPLTVGRRSAPLTMPNAILARHNDKTFVVWDGHRSEIDLTNKSVALALGVDSAAPRTGSDVHRAV